MCKSSSAQCLSDVCNLPNRLKTKGTEHNQFRYEARWNSRLTESLINTKYGSTDEWSAEDSWHFLTWSWDSWTDEGVDSSPPPPRDIKSTGREREGETHYETMKETVAQIWSVCISQSIQHKMSFRLLLIMLWCFTCMNVFVTSQAWTHFHLSRKTSLNCLEIHHPL